MATSRRFFYIATIIVAGEEKMFALAGENGLLSVNTVTVEEWVEESSTWKAADMVEKRTVFGAVTAPKHLVCW